MFPFREATMTRRIGVLIGAAVIGLSLPAAAPAAAKSPRVSVAVGDVTDRRRNDNFFNALEVELKLAGEGLEDAKGARALVRTAVDDTGRNLIRENEESHDFEKSGQQGMPPLKVSLKNPARKAVAVRELSGQVEVFLPSRDAGAVTRVDKFLSRMDRPIVSPGLKAAQAGVTVISRKTYEAEKKKNEERRKAEAESAGIAGAMAQAFSGLFEGMMGDIGENDVLLRVEDKGKKVFSAEILDAKGSRIDNQGSMTVGDFWILKYPEKLQDDASLVIYVMTPKALVSAPFSLKGIPLP
jgi:hypothetical protein